MRKNAATKGLSLALTKLANSIRAIRRNNPLRNNLMKLTAANRNNVNRAIQNYIMAVNKANYKNMKAQNALRLVQTGETSENAAIPLVQEAVKANTNVAEKLNNVREAVVNGGNSVKYGKNQNGMWKFAPNTSNMIKARWVINNNGSLIRAQPSPLPPKPFGPNNSVFSKNVYSTNDINRLSRNLNSNNSTLKNKAMNKLQNIANTYNNTAIRRMASSKLLEFRKRPINIKIRNPTSNTIMMNVRWNNNAKKWVLVSNSNKARFNLTNNRSKNIEPKATVKQAPIN